MGETIEPVEAELPPYDEASSVELSKSPGRYGLTFVFGPAEGAEGGEVVRRRKMELPSTETNDTEAVWVSEQELQDIFGRVPTRDDRQPAPLVAVWHFGD